MGESSALRPSCGLSAFHMRAAPRVCARATGGPCLIQRCPSDAPVAEPRPQPARRRCPGPTRRPGQVRRLNRACIQVAPRHEAPLALAIVLPSSRSATTRSGPGDSRRPSARPGARGRLETCRPRPVLRRLLGRGSKPGYIVATEAQRGRCNQVAGNFQDACTGPLGMARSTDGRRDRSQSSQKLQDCEERRAIEHVDAPGQREIWRSDFGASQCTVSE